MSSCTLSARGSGWTGTRNRSAKFSTVWWRAPGNVRCEWQTGLSTAELRTAHARLAQTGYGLMALSGYEEDGRLLHAAIWYYTGASKQLLHLDLMAAEVRPDCDRMSRQGFALAFLDAYSHNGADRYAALWQQPGSTPLSR